MTDTPNKNLWTNVESFPPSMTEIKSNNEINKSEYAEKVKQEFLHSWNAYKNMPGEKIN